MASWWIRNLVGAPGALALPDNYVAGNAFHCEVDGEVQKIGVRKLSAGDTLAGLAVWRMSDQARILHVTTGLPTSGAADWLEYTLPDVLPLVAGQEYRVVADWNGAVNCATWSYSVVPAHPDGTLSKLASGMGCASASGINSYPGSLDSGLAYNTDLFVQQTGVPGGGNPPTNTDIENALVRWFSANSDNTRQAHLPWLTHEAAEDALDAINDARPVVDATLDLVENALGPLGQLTSGALRSLLNAIQTDLQNRVGNVPGAVMGPGNPTIADVMNAVGSIESGNPHLRDQVSILSADYTPGAVVVGQGSSDVTIAADAYTFTITNPAVLRSFSVIDGAPVPRHIGSLTPIDGGFLGRHTPIIWASHYLREPGTRMQGVRVLVDPDVEWEVTPYDYTP